MPVMRWRAKIKPPAAAVSGTGAKSSEPNNSSISPNIDSNRLSSNRNFLQEMQFH